MNFGSRIACQLLRTLLTLVLLASCFQQPFGLAQEPTAPATSNDATTTKSSIDEQRDARSNDVTTNAASIEKDRQRQVVIAGLMLAGLVAVVLVLFVMIALWWAMRWRRKVDHPLPHQHPGDPLWYLRKGQPSDLDDDSTQGISDVAPNSNESDEKLNG